MRGTMLPGLDELSQILKTYQVDVEDLEELEIDTASERAFALAINPDQELDVWRLFRALVEQTQCYPLLVEDWGGDRAFFSRYWYAQEQSDGYISDVTPDAILATVPLVGTDAYLRDQEASHDEELAEAIEWERER